METFVLVIFWLYAISIFLIAVTIACSDYPRTVKRNLGVDMISIMEYMVIAGFAWYYTWGLA